MSEASERNLEIVRRFEDEFKNKENHAVVDELMSEDFIHHALFPGLPPGGEGVKAVGQFVVGAIRDISINIDHMVSQDALVAESNHRSGHTQRHRRADLMDRESLLPVVRRQDL